jgi:hypothetical protein
MLAPRPYELLTRPTKQPRPRNEPEDVGGGRTGSQYAIQGRLAGSGQTKLGNGKEGGKGGRMKLSTYEKDGGRRTVPVSDWRNGKALAQSFAAKPTTTASEGWRSREDQAAPAGFRRAARWAGRK